MAGKRIYLAFLIVTVLSSSVILIYLYPPNTLVSSEKIGGGTVWIYIPVSIIHDPPGDGSNQSLVISLESNSRLYTVIKFFTNISVDLGIETTVQEGSYVKSWVKPIKNGFEVTFASTSSGVRERIGTWSSVDKTHSGRIGPLRRSNGKLYGGCVLVGNLLEIAYELKVNIYRTWSNEYKKQLVLSLRATEIAMITMLLADMTKTSFGYFPTGDVLDNVSNKVFVGEVTFKGSKTQVLKMRTKIESPTSFNYFLRNFYWGEEIVPVWVSQTIRSTGEVYYNANLTLYDDDSTDWYKVSIYNDTFFHTYDFKVIEYNSTNPEEEYEG